MIDQVEVICLDSDDEVPSTNKENILNHTSAAIKSEGGVKLEQAAGGGGTSIFSQSTNDDDEVEVVDGSDLQSELLTHAAAATTAAAGSDDELEIVGTKNEANYIHNRQNCLVCRYKPCSSVEQWHAENRLFCTKCYCFVCDKPAVECEDWFEGEKGVCVDEREGGDGDDAKPAAEENNVASDGTSNDCQEDSETVGSESNAKRLNDKTDTSEAAATTLGSDKESASQSSNAAAKESSTDNTCNSKLAATTLIPEQDNPTEALAKPSNVEVNDAKTATEATTETKDSNQPSTTAEVAAKPSSPTAKPASVANPDKHKPHKNHCQATDDGPLKSFWRSMRLAIKSGNDPSTVASASTSRTNANSEHELQLFANRYAFDLERAMQQANGAMAAASRRTSVHRRRGRSNNPPTSNRRRTRPRNSSLGPSDHRQRIRAQNMLEALYQNPDGWN